MNEKQRDLTGLLRFVSSELQNSLISFSNSQEYEKALGCFIGECTCLLSLVEAQLNLIDNEVENAD